MSSPQSDYHDTWVREYLSPRYPELVSTYLDARAIFENGKASGSLGQPEVDRLLAYARSSRTPLGENVATMLGKLCTNIPTLGAVIRLLATGRRQHERVNALVALHSCPPTALHVELLALLLQDKSARVRALAANKIVIHRIKELGAALEWAASRESKVEVADEMRADLDYLNQGFHARQKGDSVWVTCRPPHGGSVSKMFTLQEFQTVGSTWITDQLCRATNEA